ncbi:MAG: O-antigen ligase family protein [Alphaproteobacteria bacterium]|nr:O-antigen ligase family protein [Alphaproteobacteria bacterium]
MQADLINVPVFLTRAMQGVAFAVVAALPFDNAIFHLFSFLLLFAYIASLHWIGFDQVKQALVASKWVHISFGAIWAIMLISNALNAQSEEAWRTMLQFGPRYWLLFTIFSCLLHWRVTSERPLFVAATLGLALHFIPYTPAMVDLNIFDTRFQGMDRNPNTAGFKAAGLAMLSLYLAFYEGLARRFRYPLAVFFGAMALIALLATGNRGSWVALFISSGVFLVVMFPKHPRLIALVAIAIGLIGGLVFTQFAGPARRLAMLLDGDSSYRTEIWQNAWNLFTEKPIFGYGLDVREELLTRKHLYHEHNIFVSVLTAMGTAGLIAYSVMLASIARLGLQFKNHFSLLMMLMMLIVGMFAYDFYRSQLFLAHFVILAAVAAHQRAPAPAR